MGAVKQNSYFATWGDNNAKVWVAVRKKSGDKIVFAADGLKTVGTRKYARFKLTVTCVGGSDDWEVLSAVPPAGWTHGNLVYFNVGTSEELSMQITQQQPDQNFAC